MVRPSKYSNPDRTVINLALIMLSRLRNLRVDDLNTLKTFAGNHMIGGDVLFMPALNFLYLMGLIEYRPKTDAIEYVGPNETV